MCTTTCAATRRQGTHTHTHSTGGARNTHGHPKGRRPRVGGAKREAAQGRRPRAAAYYSPPTTGPPKADRLPLAGPLRTTSRLLLARVRRFGRATIACLHLRDDGRPNCIAAVTWCAGAVAWLLKHKWCDLLALWVAWHAAEGATIPNTPRGARKAQSLQRRGARHPTRDEPACAPWRGFRGSKFDDGFLAALGGVCAGGHGLEDGTGVFHHNVAPEHDAFREGHSSLHNEAPAVRHRHSEEIEPGRLSGRTRCRGVRGDACALRRFNRKCDR